MTGFLDLPPEIRNRIYFYTESLIAAIGWAYVPQDTGVSGWKVDGDNYVAFNDWYCEYSPSGLNRNHAEISRAILQPSITKVCRQVRKETLPIFYGANTFFIQDEYFFRNDGVRTPFIKILLNWFTKIKHHAPLFTDIQFCCGGLCAQNEDEIICALTDVGFDFKPGVLNNTWYLMRMQQDAEEQEE